MASPWMRLWTTAALAVVLHAGMGCQARHPSLSSESHDIRTVSANHQPHPLPALPSARRRDRNARVFRGSVSSAPAQDDVIAH